MTKKALLIGNSDGIGLGLTRRLLDKGWQTVGVSRSPSPIEDPSYIHHEADVAREGYTRLIKEIIPTGVPDLCLYLAGIGELLDPENMAFEEQVFQVNLMGLVRTVAGVLPGMIRRGSGHIIGISSLADELLSAEAPSYHGSKAGFSNYLGGLNLAMRPHGISITNVRFGFVDTKMAKGDVRPFMMTVEKAVDHLERCMAKQPMVHTAPKAAIPLVKFRKWMMRLGLAG